jgi:AcrR family transcriptional regulator
VARRRPETRFDDLLEAATEVFSERGFRRTQMADVARRLGVSPGALYGYVESKDALFDLAVRRAFGEDVAPPALPAPTPGAGELAEHVNAGMRRRLRTPALAAAAAHPAPADVAAELEGLLGELFDALARNAAAIRLIERSAPDRPELAELYFGRGRGGLVERWRRYLERRIGEGRLRPVPDAAIAARLVLETVAWFAWHRLGDPVPQPMDPALARETVVAVLARGLLPGGPP